MNRRFKQLIAFFGGLVSGRLTLRRGLNRAGLLLSEKWRQHRVWGLPSEIFIEPTNYCNLQCPLCPSGTNLMKRPRGYLSEKTFARVMRQLGGSLLNLRLWHYGEPLLHPKITDFIRQAKRYRIPHVMLSTNIIPLKKPGLIGEIIDSGLDQIRVCLDGMSSESYQVYRKNGNFDEAMESLRSLIAEKRRKNSVHPMIELQFIIMRHNEREVPVVRDLAAALGVDKLSFKNCDVGLGEQKFKDVMFEYLPDRKKNIIKDLLSDPQAHTNGCSWIWKACVILWNGDVVPCCYDWDGNKVFGNIHQMSFKSIWNSPEYVEFRRRVMEDRRHEKLCSHCPEGYGDLFYQDELEAVVRSAPASE